MDNNKTQLELFYNSPIDVQTCNQIFDDLKIFFIEYTKAKFPIISALSAVRQERFREIEEKRLEDLAQNIGDKIQCMDKEKIDYNFFNTEEFVRIVLYAFEKAQIDYRENKIQYYANALLNYSTKEFSENFYKERIIEIISKLTVEHLLVLKKAYEIHRNKEKNATNKLEFSDGLEVDGINKDIVKYCILDLKAEGLINEATGAILSYAGGSYYITEYGTRCIEIITLNI